jgi:hypothetical protein
VLINARVKHSTSKKFIKNNLIPFWKYPANQGGRRFRIRHFHNYWLCSSPDSEVGAGCVMLLCKVVLLNKFLIIIGCFFLSGIAFMGRRLSAITYI